MLFAAWCSASVLFGVAWAWWNRPHRRQVNQWRRYRGIAHLRGRADVLDLTPLARRGTPGRPPLFGPHAGSPELVGVAQIPDSR